MNKLYDNHIYTIGDIQHYIPYNAKNTIITCNDVINIMKICDISYSPINIKLYIEALTHTSYIKNTFCEYEKYLTEYKKKNNDVIELMDRSYERLEFVGDSVLKSIISTYLYKRYPDEDEGFMTDLKIKLENKTTFANFSNILGLSSYIIVSYEMEMNNGRNNSKILEDVFESFIGALFYDAGYYICEAFVIWLLENRIDFSELIINDTNYKAQLLRLYHKNKWTPPIYIDINIDDNTTNSNSYMNRLYKVGVLNNNKEIIGIGISYNKKQASQIAAEEAIKTLIKNKK